MLWLKTFSYQRKFKDFQPVVSELKILPFQSQDVADSWLEVIIIII